MSRADSPVEILRVPVGRNLYLSARRGMDGVGFRLYTGKPSDDAWESCSATAASVLIAMLAIANNQPDDRRETR